MWNRWSRVLLLGAFVAVAAGGFFLSRPGWLLDDNSPVRNVIEALSWFSGIASVVGAGVATSWRWLRAGHGGSGASGSGAPTTPTGLVGRALHLVEGRLPVVSEVSLLELGVKPAMDTETDIELPPFVRRDEDENIEWAIAQGGMVLLHGQAASGKSRAAIEALHRLRPNHDLLVPCDGPSLRALVESKYIISNTVIWLDELERYLVPGGVDLSLLHRLSQRGYEVSLVATMRDETLSYYDYASIADMDASPNITRNAVELVEQLRYRRRIRIDRHLSKEEREQAVQQPDHRVRAALSAEEGFAEYLAAGRAMFGRWSIGDGDLFHLGQALVSAAIDCRRAGYDEPVPAWILETLHPHYLAAGWRYRSDLPSVVDGIKWACKRVSGASSCLQPRSNNTYLAADYLLDSAETDGSPLALTSVPEETWNALLELSDVKHAYAVGVAAWLYDNKRIAERAFQSGAEEGDTEAMQSLGVVLLQEERLDEAEVWFRESADRGNSLAMGSLGSFCERQGRLEEAEAWYREAAERGNSLAMGSLGGLYEQRGVLDEAETWFRKSADAGRSLAMGGLGSVYERQGRLEEAEAWYRQGANQGGLTVMGALGAFCERQGRLEEAEAWYREAAERGKSLAMGSLGAVCERQGRLEEAESWYRQAANQGEILAMLSLGRLCERQGRMEEAETLFRQGADNGDYEAMARLGDSLVQQEDVAEAWYRKGSAGGSIRAMSGLGSLCERQGRFEEAETWFRQAADYGSSAAMCSLGFLLMSKREEREAETWFRQGADHGNYVATALLGFLLERQGEEGEAETCYQMAVSDGSTDVKLILGYLFEGYGKVERSAAWYEEAANGGDGEARQKLNELLEGRLEDGEGL